MIHKKLLSWQNIWNSRQIAAYIEEKIANQGEVLRGGNSSIYLSLSNTWKPCMELSTVGYVISERHWKSTFDSTEMVNNHELKRETGCQKLLDLFPTFI